MRVFSLLVGLSLLLASTAALALPTKTQVVVIGNNFGDPHEIGLRFAQDDANAVGEVLRRLGGVPSSQITTLLDADADAVRAALLRANDSLRGAQHAALVVYYSGHADADALHLGGTRLRFEELKALVKASPAPVRILMVDGCRSGGLSRVKGVKAAPTFAMNLEDEPTAEGMAVITSSTADESSQESDHLGGSFFSHHLVNGLRGAADRDADGTVTLAEAYAYAYDGTIRSSGQTMTLQHPTYAWDMKGRGGLVMTRVVSATARSGRLVLDTTALHLVTAAPGGQVVAEVQPLRPRTTLSLAPGRYRVQERRDRVYLDYQVTLTPSQVVDLATLPARTLEYDRLVRKGGGVQRAIHGLNVMGGARGEIIGGEGTTSHLLVGYGVDTEYLSAGLRLRGSTLAVSAD
ncbi:MAG: caspase family protein, partial [Myxococcales bacterium]|nr:caspase family protein [Myxococcales bacterium]